MQCLVEKIVAAFGRLDMLINNAGLAALALFDDFPDLSLLVTEFHEAQLDKNGVPRGARGRAIYSKKMMSAERCAEITLRAAYQRRHEVLIGPGVRVALLKALAPGLVDWLAVKVFLATAARPLG